MLQSKWLNVPTGQCQILHTNNYNTKRRYSGSEPAKMADPTMWLANGGRK